MYECDCVERTEDVHIQHMNKSTSVSTSVDLCGEQSREGRWFGQSALSGHKDSQNHTGVLTDRGSPHSAQVKGRSHYDVKCVMTQNSSMVPSSWMLSVLVLLFRQFILPLLFYLTFPLGHATCLTFCLSCHIPTCSPSVFVFPSHESNNSHNKKALCLFPPKQRTHARTVSGPLIPKAAQDWRSQIYLMNGSPWPITHWPRSPERRDVGHCSQWYASGVPKGQVTDSMGWTHVKRVIVILSLSLSLPHIFNILFIPPPPPP